MTMVKIHMTSSRTVASVRVKTKNGSTQRNMNSKKMTNQQMRKRVK